MFATRFLSSFLGHLSMVCLSMISKGKRPRLADTFSFCAISALSQRYVILELISHESNGISHFVAKFD